MLLDNSASSVENSAAFGGENQLKANKQELDALLERILSSPHFRQSARSKAFLRYVVERYLDGDAEGLKERTIAVEVFGRKPDYDASEDAIVRVKASDVRKRLAQYYLESGAEERLQIQIPLGGYAPTVTEFGASPKPSEAPAEPPPESRPRRSFAVAFALAAGLAIGVAIGAFGLRPTAPVNVPVGGVLEEFWRPAIEVDPSVIIQYANPNVYLLNRDEQGRETPVSAQDQYMGRGDGVSGAHLSALFAKMNKPAALRPVGSVSVAEMRGHPTVLIGAFNNPWTMKLMREQRFGFERVGDALGIVDYRGETGPWSLPGLGPAGSTHEDYAIISRLATGEPGRVLVAIAGITQYGTHAAGDFVVHESTLRQALEDAPPGWADGNLQIVIHLPVIQETPGAAEVVAKHFWPAASAD